uniref:CTCHY-type domain-containing protein n=1 Tax=Graphocephala atropunctata TaxID=36148 RepID=A0A1B6LWJ6_9HEMI
MAVVKVLSKHLKDNPQCPHGPTLKFIRVQNDRKQEFFACSAYRDRKHCPFYHAAGETFSETLQEVWAMEKKRMLPSIDHAALEARLEEVKQVSPMDRFYCHTCSQLDLAARRAQHSSHDVQVVISDKMLSNPSQILKPKEGSKKEAQYLFTDSTTEVIVTNLERAKVSRVLCLGTPRVHENIQATGGKMQSLLLDFDHRYHSFWPRKKFVWYNMFNRHVMACDDKAKHALRNFVDGEGKVALVMDPPFGGHIHPLSATVKHFTRHADNLIVIWCFPYFRERHILEKFPRLMMMDYKVQYHNHKEFNNGSKGRKLGSPVRLFTNIKPKKFVLPRAQGYWLCKPCAKWVSPENKHCVKCKACTSKDGRSYIHCDKCKVCVKPQWSHCSTCEKCLPSPHSCSALSNEQSDDENTEPRHKRMKMIKIETKSKSMKRSIQNMKKKKNKH